MTVLSHASSKSTFWYPAGDQRVATSCYFNSIERYHAESPNQAKPCQSLTDSHGLHRKGWRESTVIRCWTTGCSHFSLPSPAIMSQETQGRQGFHAAVKRSLQTSREHPASIHLEAWIFHASNVLSGFILWEEKMVRGLCRGRLIITILFLFSIISLCWIRWISERFFIPLEIKTEQSKIVRKYRAY